MAVYTAIDDPEVYFRILTWSGNGSSDRALTFDTTDTTMEPDLVWIKNRSSSTNHAWLGTGLTTGEYIRSNDTHVQTSGADVLNSIDSNGFEIGSSGAIQNDSGDDYVAWCWKESADAGFDIVNYTGNGTAGNTFSHSLSAVPHFVICKILATEVAEWYTYNESLGNTKNIFLHTDAAPSTSNLWWNATTPTSSVVTLGDQTGNNGSSRNFIAYLFAPKQGFSKFGSYTANGSTDGAFVYTGFRPAFVMTKLTSTTGGGWEVVDSKRDGYNGENNRLYPNDTAAEGSGNDYDLLSNGFKVKQSGGSQQDGRTNLYMAFAESPFVNSNGVPCNAR